MRVYEDIDAQDFRDKAWSGASDTLDDLTDEQVEKIFDYLDDTGEGMRLTELNDFFWFERDTIASWLGYSDYDQLVKRGENDNEYYEDEEYFIKITHGDQGVDDNQTIEDMLYDFSQICDGAYTVFDDSEEDYSDEEERYIGSAEASVSEAMLDYLKDNGVTFVDTI